MTSLDDECASFGDLYISDTNEYYTFVTLMFSNPKTTDQVKGIITEQMYQRNMKGAMCVNWEEPLPKNVQSKELVDLLRTDLGPVPTDHNTFRAQISDWLSLFVEAVNVTDATKKFFHRLFIELVNRRTVTGMFYSDDTKMLVFDTFDELMDAYNSVSDDETIAKFREQKSFDHALDLTVLNVIEQLKDIMLANNLLKKKMLGFNVDIKTIKTESDRSGNVKNLPVRIQQQTCLEQLVHPEYPLVGFMMIDESTTVNVVYGKDINGLTVVTKW